MSTFFALRGMITRLLGLADSDELWEEWREIETEQDFTILRKFHTRCQSELHNQSREELVKKNRRKP